MIKILFFIETLKGGGAEKVLKNLVNSMDKSRFDITVQTLYNEDVAGELDEKVNYRFCYPYKNSIFMGIMRTEAALGLIYEFHIKGDYDIEVAYLECGATKIMASSTNKKAKKVAWVHCDLSKKAGDFESFVKSTKGYYAKYDKVVCVSKDVESSFIKGYGNTPEAITLYNCFDDSEILRKSQLPLPFEKNENCPVCIAVGRLTEQKGFDRLLSAHKRLLDEGIFHKLWVLGDGEDKAALEKFAETNGLSKTVSFLGFCDNPYPYIKVADFYVCSSRYEGFSTTVVESLVIGTPVVTTNCTGMKEILGESEYGLIVENSEQGIFDGMKRLFTDETLLDTYKKRAALRGCFFKKNSAVLKTESFFENLISE